MPVTTTQFAMTLRSASRTCGVCVRSLRWVTVLLAIVLTFSVRDAFAQFSGNIQVTVVDGTGAAIAWAQVSLKSDEQTVPRTAQSDDRNLHVMDTWNYVLNRGAAASQQLVASVDGNANNGTFGRSTAQYTPRNMDAGARINF